MLVVGLGFHPGTAYLPAMSKRKPSVPKKRARPVRWAVSHLASKAIHVASVEAPSADAAIAKVVESYGIPEHERVRLMARRSV